MATGKREFRRQSPPDQPAYPELEAFDTGRRQFLTRLGGALLGAGALGALLSACGDRAVGEDDPDIDQPQGVQRRMDARVDTRPQVEMRDLSGVGPRMDARVDRAPPDMPQMGGVPRMMDAQLDVLAPDAGPPKSDQ